MVVSPQDLVCACSHHSTLSCHAALVSSIAPVVVPASVAATTLAVSGGGFANTADFFVSTIALSCGGGAVSGTSVSDTFNSVSSYTLSVNTSSIAVGGSYALCVRWQSDQVYVVAVASFSIGM